MNSSVRIIGFAVLLVAALCCTAAAQQQAPAAARGAAAPEPPVKMEFVKVSAGEFMMGCSMGDTMCDAAIDFFKTMNLGPFKETPAHMVKISKPFEIGKYVVTQGQWQTVMGSASPSTFQKGDNYPAENVSWNQVQDFVTKINSQNDGFKYRLPTEAEWEYAARAGTTGPSTGDPLDTVAWFNQNGGPSTKPVGKKAPNAWGLYDVQGNVWQWVQDTYSDYKKNAVTDPTNSKGDPKVLRGGSWDMPASVARVSARLAIPANFKNNNTGFRLVREAK